MANDQKPKDQENIVREDRRDQRDQFSERWDQITHDSIRIIKVERGEAWPPPPPDKNKE